MTSVLPGSYKPSPFRERQLTDDRRDYGEIRVSAYVPLNDRLYFVGYTERPEVRRIITFRKTNNREMKYYEDKQE